MKAIICDIDGTVCDLNGRNPYDASKCEYDLPHEEIIDYLHHQNLPVLLITGRNDAYRSQTESWLKEHDVPYEKLFMRTTGDVRKASQVKAEIYDNEIAGEYEITEVIEDLRPVVQMWRKKGLKVRQVTKGYFDDQR